MTGATQTQIRGDTAANIAAITPASREVLYDLTNNRLHTGDGSTAGGWAQASAADVQKNAFTWANTVSGTANAITLAFTPATLADSAGQELNFTPASANTGATTVAVDSRSAVTIKKFASGMIADLAANDLLTTCPAKIIKCGSYYILLNPCSPQKTGALTLISSQSVSGVANITFAPGILTSAYKKYILEIDSWTGGTGGYSYTPLLEVYTSGAWDTTNYIAPFNNSGLTVGQNASSNVMQATIEFSNPSLSAAQLFDIKYNGYNFGGTHISGQVFVNYDGGTAAMISGLRIIDLNDPSGAHGGYSGNFVLYGLQPS